MPFELIMLLGFLGIALLGLLPAAPAEVADDSFRGKRREHNAREQRRSIRAGRLMRRDVTSRRRSAGRAAA